MSFRASQTLEFVRVLSMHMGNIILFIANACRSPAPAPAPHPILCPLQCHLICVSFYTHTEREREREIERWKK